MPQSARQKLVLAVGLAALLLGGIVVWAILVRPRKGSEATVALPPVAEQPSPQAAPTELYERELELPVVDTFQDVETTVIWPARVELELERAARFPSEPGVPAIGSGRRARLAGRVVGPGGSGAVVEIRFLHGLNAGRVLHSNSEGFFGATDLYPGLNVVELAGASIPGSYREVRLRQNAETLLNIGYGLPGVVQGTVYDAKKQPLADVRVQMEGRYALTDAEGIFRLPGITAGRDVPILLSKEGYATYTEQVGVTANFTIPADKLQFILQESASVEILLTNQVGEPGETMGLVLPANPESQRDFPWYTVNPIRIPESGRAVIEGLPPRPIHVRLFRKGAQMQPAVSAVNLHPGAKKQIRIETRPETTISGIVLNPSGEPVANARVQWEAPDRVAAMLQYFGELPLFLESEAFPMLPVGAESAVTGPDGKFTFSSYSRLAPRRYVQAWSEDGKMWACSIASGEGPLELRLEPPAEGEGTLELDFKGRFQGLPVEVIENGRPFHSSVLPAGRPLVLRELVEGYWKVRVTWQGEEVYAEESLPILGSAQRELVLPQAAIEGQDEETRMRAGKQP